MSGTDGMDRRLRDLLDAAAGEPPHRVSVAAVRRRVKRRRVMEYVAGAAAVALVAVAVSIGTGASGHGPPASAAAVTRGRVSVGSASPASTPSPTAAAGTVLAGCGAANPGAVGSGWQSGLKAGPLYFTPRAAAISARHSVRTRAGPPQLYAVVVVIAGLRPGSAVVVRPAPAAVPYLRFLFGPQDSLNPGTRYTMRSGESGVTFVACAAGTGFASGQTVTDYYGGFLVSGNRCVPIRVWAADRAAPYRASLGSCG